jgi:hypothetical protein
VENFSWNGTEVPQKRAGAYIGVLAVQSLFVFGGEEKLVQQVFPLWEKKFRDARGAENLLEDVLIDHNLD